MTQSDDDKRLLELVKKVKEDMKANQPTVDELLESISEGFDKLRENGESTEQPYAKLRLLDDLLWNTLVSLGHS